MEAILAALPRISLKQYRWALWMLLGALGIHVMEAIYRVHRFQAHAPLAETIESVALIGVIMGCRIIADLSLFWGFRKAPTFLTGWAVFIFFIVISRVLIGFYAGEPFNLTIAFGLALLIYGLYATMQANTTGRHLMLGTTLFGIGVGTGIVENGFADIAAGGIGAFGLWMGALLVSAIVIAIQEYFARKGSFDRFFFRYFLMFAPFSAASSLGLYYGYSHAVPTFMFAWAVYTIYDVVIRVVNNCFFMKESFKLVHGLGMALIVTGTFLTYVGGTLH